MTLRAVIRSLCVALLALLPWFNASAHEMSIAELNLREVLPGEFLWNWGQGGIGRQPQDELTPRWPEGCRTEGDKLVCVGGLNGVVTIDGVGDSYSAAMLRVLWLDGTPQVYTITASQQTARLYGSANDTRGGGEIASAYTILGVEHILGGIDHLLFVVCLLFLVGFRRKLIWTISAFTAAHSLTLIASALGWLTLRGPPVEAVIAASIVLMAVEALKREDTLARRAPAIVAFGFGLVHGLGFAGALKEIGLPQDHLLLALLTFNVGVEIGQLLTVAVVFVATRVVSRLPMVAARVPVPALYAIGSIAAFWTWQRLAAVLVG